jgi:hypothetical protein
MPAAAATSDEQRTLDNVPNWASAGYKPNSKRLLYVRRLAECIVIYWRRDAENLLSTIPGSEAQSSAAKSMAEKASSCLSFGQIGAPAHQLRGALAEALLKARRPGSVDPLKGVADYSTFSSQLTAADLDGRLDAEDKNLLVARWAAVCAVRRDRDAAASVLETQPATPEELVSLQSLNSTFSACLGAGDRLKVTAQSMRSFLAEALYWRGSATGAEMPKARVWPIPGLIRHFRPSLGGRILQSGNRAREAAQ